MRKRCSGDHAERLPFTVPLDDVAGALITSLLFVAAHSQYQNLLTTAELFPVGLITSAARIRSGGLLLPVLLHMEATALGLLFG
nr:CPBP family intramembrane glutamic endopeptidase [Klebsiella pneumoniae]VXR48205.1 CAAX amino terminal protease self- immunity [Klebsiella pneumoniae]